MLNWLGWSLQMQKMRVVEFDFFYATRTYTTCLLYYLSADLRSGG